MIKVEHITKKFGEKIALNDISFTLPNTGFVIVKGRNGSGKSTLMNILGTIDKQDSGSLTIDNQNIENLNDKELTTFRENNISFIFQDGNLFEDLTVLENIKIVGETNQLDAITKYLNIENLFAKKAKELSGGERNRVGIARSFMKNSKIVLADEPTAALDANTREKIFKLLKQLSQTRLVIMITHDTEYMGIYGDIVLTLEEGNLINIKDSATGEKTNSIKPYKNIFSPFQFSLKNSFINKKKIIRSSITLVLAFLFIVISASISSLNINKMHYDTLVLENQEIIEIESYLKEGRFMPYGYGIYTEKDLEIVKEKLGTDYIFKTITNYGNGSFYGAVDTRNELVDFYHNPSYKVNIEDISTLPKVDIGHKPEAPNEIVISSYLADSMIVQGTYDIERKYIKPTNYEELMNYEITLFDVGVKVVGIYNVELPNNFEHLKAMKYADIMDKERKYQIDLAKLGFEIENKAMNVYVTKDFEENLPKYIDSTNFYLKNYENDSSLQMNIFTNPVTLSTGETIESLEENEIIINSGIMSKLGLTIDTYLDTEINLTIKKEREAEQTLEKLQIRGVSNDEKIYLNEETIKDYVASYQKTYPTIYVTEKDPQKLKKLTEIFVLKNGFYRLSSPYSDIYVSLAKDTKIASYIFMVIAVLFSILGFFFLLNYIKGSIALHKKDVATLKCLGIKDFDILKIFGYEATFLSIISYIITLFLFIITKIITNNIISNKFGFKINILPFNIPLFILIIIIIILISFLISFLTFRKISKMSPKLIFTDESI